MKVASVGFALIAFATGIRSAWLWYHASRVQVLPMWVKDGLLEPLDPSSAHAEWIIALLETATKSSDLNRKAAIWTATTVLLTTVSTLASVI